MWQGDDGVKYERMKSGALHSVRKEPSRFCERGSRTNAQKMTIRSGDTRLDGKFQSDLLPLMNLVFR